MRRGTDFGQRPAPMRPAASPFCHDSWREVRRGMTGLMHGVGQVARGRRMRPRARRGPLRLGLSLLAALILGGGCGGPSLGQTPPTATPAAIAALRTATPVSTPTRAAKPELGEIVWAVTADAATGAPLTVAGWYPRDAPRLSAAVLATNLPAGSTIDAAWSYNDTSLDDFATRLTLDDAATQRWLSFHLARDPEALWPAGIYEVELSLNGEVVQRAAVEVRETP
jgi:hypothetical protein